jgi:hypothetical protein
MTHAIGRNFTNFHIPQGAFCPDISTGSSITLEEYAEKGLEKELQFRQPKTIKSVFELIEPNPISEWVVRAKRRIHYLCEEPKFELNDTVLKNSLEAIRILSENDIVPSLINPTGDESLLFDFFIGNKYFSLDFYSSGEIVYLYRNSELPAHVTELDITDISKVAREITQAQAR